jgi:ribosome-associated heat shock protein Hsp15
MDSVRIDKWLWAARFFKTRGLAQDAIEKGRVKVAGERVKPARGLRLGELLSLDQGEWAREVTVLGLSESRGSAPVAQALYADTPESVVAKEKARQRRAMFVEPAELLKGRPSKRDRRELDRLREE